MTERIEKNLDQIHEALEAIRNTSKVIRHGVRNKLATIMLLIDIDTPEAKVRARNEVRAIVDLISKENALMSCPLKTDCPVINPVANVVVVEKI